MRVEWEPSTKVEGTKQRRGRSGVGMILMLLYGGNRQARSGSKQAKTSVRG